MANRSAEKLFLIVLYCLMKSSYTFGLNHDVEGRGKKKIALYIYFADLVLKKIFILKIIYAVVFWVVIHKAGYFLAWFVSYLKDQKKEHHEHHEHYVPHHYYYDRHGPYKKESHGIESI